jgi:hypothetical protein
MFKFTRIIGFAIVILAANSALSIRETLELAIFNDDIELLKNEIEKTSFNINKQNQIGETLLYHAVRNQSQTCARWLLANGADPNIEHEFGRTVLHEAVKKNDLEMVALLINKGRANIEIIDQFGELPYDWALRHRSFKLANLLRPCLYNIMHNLFVSSTTVHNIVKHKVACEYPHKVSSIKWKGEKIANSWNYASMTMPSLKNYSYDVKVLVDSKFNVLDVQLDQATDQKNDFIFRIDDYKMSKKRKIKNNENKNQLNPLWNNAEYVLNPKNILFQ